MQQVHTYPRQQSGTSAALRCLQPSVSTSALEDNLGVTLQTNSLWRIVLSLYLATESFSFSRCLDVAFYCGYRVVLRQRAPLMYVYRGRRCVWNLYNLQANFEVVYLGWNFLIAHFKNLGDESSVRDNSAKKQRDKEIWHKMKKSLMFPPLRGETIFISSGESPKKKEKKGKPDSGCLWVLIKNIW